MTDLLSTIAMIIIVIALGFNLIFRIWQLNIAALIIQYICLFIMVSTVWPANLAIVKLLVGLMVSAVLGITQYSIKSEPRQKDKSIISSQVFRAFTGAIILLLVYQLTPSTRTVLSESISYTFVFSGLALISIGILQLSMTSDSLYIIIGLFSFITGFELLYAIVEVSRLLGGLLAGVNLAMALVGAWLLTKANQGESQ